MLHADDKLITFLISIPAAILPNQQAKVMPGAVFIKHLDCIFIMKMTK